MRVRRSMLSHLPFAAVMVGGVLLRVATLIGYPQPYLINDSTGYVFAAQVLHPQRGRQSGYALFMRLIPDWHDLMSVVVVQHVLGLLLGAGIYLLLVRRGVRHWLAALATVPVLLDPFQLNLEHYVLTDMLSEVLLFAGLAALALWRGLPLAAAATGGLLLGMAAVVRGIALPVVFVAALLVLVGHARWRPVLALLAAAALPIGAYATWYHHSYGRYSTGGFPTAIFYGRVATFVDCGSIDLPADERALCPTEPRGKRLAVDHYTWSADSPLHRFVPADGKDPEAVVHDFSIRVVRQQPLSWVDATLYDVGRGFVPRRTLAWGGRAPNPWQFALAVKRVGKVRLLTGDPDPAVDLTFARPLTSYNAVYLPGPLYAAGLLLGLLAIAGVGRATRSGERFPVALFTLSTLVLLIATAAVAGFSWRYQLPQLALVPPAAALAATAIGRSGDPRDGRTLRESLAGLRHHRRESREQEGDSDAGDG